MAYYYQTGAPLQVPSLRQQAPPPRKVHPPEPTLGREAHKPPGGQPSPPKQRPVAPHYDSRLTNSRLAEYDDSSRKHRETSPPSNRDRVTMRHHAFHEQTSANSSSRPDLDYRDSNMPPRYHPEHSRNPPPPRSTYPSAAAATPPVTTNDPSSYTPPSSYGYGRALASHQATATTGDSVGISLEPEFKAISSLLTDITKFRIFDERDASAAIKISRALFQAFMKFKLNDKNQSSSSPADLFEEEKQLKRLLSHLIEVEEGKLPQLNLNDPKKLSHKQVQVAPEVNSRAVETLRDDITAAAAVRPTRTLLDDIKYNAAGGKRSLDSPVQFLPDTLQPRRRDERDDGGGGGPSTPKRLSTRDGSSPPGGYHSGHRPAARSRSRSPPPSRNASLAGLDNGRAAGTRDIGVLDDRTVSVKMVRGCKVSRFIRTRYGGLPRNFNQLAADMEIEEEPPPRNSFRPETFTMKLKPTPTLSQAKTVAAIKAGMSPHLYK